ncbi:MAG: biopolymer transporter ExbD [Deltaproteobacteria bacterium]|jgi:biopolymer transport protein ExbD|nr:biopolymer transporter ExbD [Deltaproteobacteria bacterium]
MSVRSPGGLGGGLSGIALGKNQIASRTKKALSASLNLTAMVDFMSVIVIFLLMNFSASGDAMFTQPDIRLPEAAVGEEIMRVPVITVSVNGITLEGNPVADSQQVLMGEGDSGLERLAAGLLREKETFKELRPGEAFDGRVIIAADEHVPYKLVRRVFNVAAQAAYVRVNYVIRLGAKTD